MNSGPIEVCRWFQRHHATGRQQAGDGTQSTTTTQKHAMTQARQFLREPAKPYELPHRQRIKVKEIPLASGYEELDEDEDGCLGSLNADALNWSAYSWDCPACGSLLLAIVCDSPYRTGDTAPAACPTCGDASAYINSSCFPEVRCLIDGMKRMTDDEFGSPWVPRES